MLVKFCYFKDNYKLIAVHLSKQKALDSDSRAIDQIIFTDRASADTTVHYILDQSKKTKPEFSKGTTKVY